jgi:hypothetical protein
MSTTAPAWVRKRDGRLVPFQADRISRSLFAATEALGRPDAFLARELTDGVLHFLSGEGEGHIPTTADIAELLAKVVRELGHPALARAYADRVRAPERTIAVEFAATESLPSVVARCTTAYSLGAVFTPDLAAAHRDGLLTLTGLEAPLQLAGSVIGSTGPLWERLLEARQHTGGFIALDGAEHQLPRSLLRADDAAAGFVRQLDTGLSGTPLQAVINLNAAPVGPGAADPADGPLFSGLRASPDADRLTVLADALLHAVAASATSARIEWHLSERDFGAQSVQRLRRVAQLAAEGTAMAFVLDRPRRPIRLADGLSRNHPALLLMVGIHLARLADLPGAGSDQDLFLRKLGTLARWAVSAAVQKREFVRRHAADGSPLTRGFLLERARLLVAPVGLDDAVRSLGGGSLCEDRGAAIGRRIVERLREVLHAQGSACLIETTLDSPPEFRLNGVSTAAGVTPWSAESPVPKQLAAAWDLHGAARGGTAAVLLADHARPQAETLVEWLRCAWEQTEVERVRFLRPAAGHRQLTLPADAPMTD